VIPATWFWQGASNAHPAPGRKCALSTPQLFAPGQGPLQYRRQFGQNRIRGVTSGLPVIRPELQLLRHRGSIRASAIMCQLRCNISTASLFASPLAEEIHLTTYGANALAISIHMGLVQSSLGSAAARAKVQRRRRSKSTSARSARRLIMLRGSA
jgi:hypothetical protein